MRKIVTRLAGYIGAAVMAAGWAGTAHAALDAYLASTATNGLPVVVTLTVTNTGGSAEANVTAQLWSSGAAGTVTAATPATVASLGAGVTQVFEWTMTPSAAGTIIFSATASADGPIASVESSATTSVAAVLDARLDSTAVAGATVVLRLTVTNTGTAPAVNVLPQAWVTSGSVNLGAPTPASVASLAVGAKTVFVWTATPTAAGSLGFTATASANGPIASGSSSTAPTVVAGALDAMITFSKSITSVGSTTALTVRLTVTNSGGTAITNVIPQFSAVGPVVITSPTPLSAVSLAPGEKVNFILTASPTGSSGILQFTGNAVGDGPIFSSLKMGTVLVPAPALNTQLSVKSGSQYVSAGVGTPLLFTVTNTGGAAVTTLKAVAWATTLSGTSTTYWGGVGPQPASVASVLSGAKNVFSWTFTPTADQVGTAIVFTASSTGDGGALATPISTTLWVQTAPAITVQFVATSQTVAGGPFIIVLTASNSGQAAAIIAVTTTQFRVSGSGTAATVYVAPANTTNVFVAGGGTVILSWTATAKTVGTGMKISNSVYITDYNSGTILTRAWGETNAVKVLALAAMTNVLKVARTSAVIGKPVEFQLFITNTGGTTLLNVTAGLSCNGLGVGTPVPASLATVAPGEVKMIAWAYTPKDSAGLMFYADATGFTMSSTGLVAVSATQVSVSLPGLPPMEITKTFAFPSPARDATRFAYLMAGPGTVKIRVYNAAGELAATVEEVVAIGPQSSALTTSGLAPGVYYYLLTRDYDSGSSDKADLAKFVVVH